MSAHTPGQWDIDISQEHAFVVHSNGIVIADVFKPQEAMFATMRTASPEMHTEAEFNARLIAAAPELLTFVEMVAAGNTEQRELEERAAALVYYARYGERLAKAEGRAKS